MKLYSVEQVMREPARGYFQFSPGARDGIPWRHDSVYLPLAVYERLATLFRDHVRWFHPHGVTPLDAAGTQRLADALHACAATGGDMAPLAASLAQWLSAHANVGITIERL
jgi:hypothetical protein